MGQVVKGRRVAIAGVALSDMGRVDNRTPFELIAQSSRRALADAGLTKADIDGVGSTGLGTMAPIDVCEYMGITPRWIDSTAVGGAAWEVMAAHAADAISAGHADVILLTYGSTARADLRRKLRTASLDWGSRGPLQWEVPYGHTLIAKYAMAARRHMHEYGTTIEQLAQISVSARANAFHNPDAFVRDPITIDDVLAGPMIADPFTKLQCCIRSDGGAAVVLVAEDRVKDPAKEPIWILGTGESTSHMSMSQWDDFTSGPAKIAGQMAFERAGVRPEEIDVAEVYDAFTYMLLITLEDLGFCGRGEGGAFVEGGRLELGGSLPTNTDGGGLSACHPGMRGLFLIVEAVRQLRGESGLRQVPDAKLACVSGTGGWFCSNGTMILGR
jgi:acetyl-CoA acetyltransferase